MTLLFVVVIIAVVAGVAVLVVRDQPVVADDPVQPRRLVWPPSGTVAAADVDAARFAVALRGYRMDEVDRVLTDVATALAERDARIAALEAGHGDPVDAPTATTPTPTALGADAAPETVTHEGAIPDAPTASETAPTAPEDRA